jgi:hypothetical protein
MNKICSYEVKGIIVWFKPRKPLSNLKFKIFGHCSIIFEPQNDFVVLHLTHSKSQKSLQLIWKWTRYVILKRKESLFGLSKENQFEFWSSSSLVMYLYKIKCIYNIVCIVLYNQNVKSSILKDEGKTNCTTTTKVTKSHLKFKCRCTHNCLSCMQPVASSCKWVG